MNRERGVVLPVTVIICAVLTLAMTTRRLAAGAGYRRAMAAWRRAQAMEWAESALDMARWSVNTSPGPPEKNATYRFIFGDVPAHPVEAVVRLEDEQGKVNINRLVFPSGEINTPLIRVFQRLISPGTPVRELSESLRTLKKRFPRGFFSPGVLRLADMRGAFPPETHLRDTITVFGSGRINLNTAPREVLRALLQGRRETAVDAVIARRQEEPFRSIFGLKRLARIDEEVFRSIFPVIGVHSGVLTLDATVELGETTARCACVFNYREGMERMLRYRKWWS